jgi:multicomponent K+:H+ antiporter subunit D
MTASTMSPTKGLVRARMSNLVLLPLLVPLAGGLLALFGARAGLKAERVAGIVATLFMLPVAIWLFGVAAEGRIAVYALGGWPAPFGITLVLDRLAAWMILVTSVVAAGALLFSIGRADESGRHFHVLFQLQLLGIYGAFLAGDLFNLFVFFEVLLIASYALLSHGAGPGRTMAAIRVAVLNLLGSTVFLVAVACLYSAAGTLNFADLAVRGVALPADRLGLWQAGAWLLVVVFALKAALLPLGFWLPGAYGAADGAIAALFAVLTKVGVVAIVRCGSLIFPGIEIGPAIWLAALGTLVLGFTGMMAARRLSELAAHAVVVSVGVLLVSVALFTREALAAALFYIAHGTLATAALFLVCARIGMVRGETGDLLVAGPAFRGRVALPTAYLLAAVAVAGLPPLGGFLAKLAILDAALRAPGAAWTYAAVLSASLFSIVALARAGTTVFWKVGQDRGEVVDIPRWRPLAVSGVAVLLVALAMLALFAGPAFEQADEIASQLLDRDSYVRAVLGVGLAGDS